MWYGIVNSLLGLWMMFAPAVLEIEGGARTNELIIGPILISFAFVTIWSVLRQMRYAVMVLGLWEIAATLILDYPGWTKLSPFAVGVLVVILAWLQPPADMRQFAGGWLALKKS